MNLNEKNVNEYSEEDGLRAVHALNMCTVAVSQIVDFNDLYLLEEQYDNILNNINLKRMPKDDALLNILTEMLNTITFFRIQDLKKKQIEKDYQRRVKNAIWSAVPSINLFASGNPLTAVMSIVTTVGTGYMNYRREKYGALSDKERSEMELQIVAIEQFDALRRELFSTAWRLASNFDFADELRLTERQIHQYNEILLETNEVRKYARLEAIKKYFDAFPPFWYSFANSAMYIAETSDDENVRNKYHLLALEHYKKYFSFNEYSILREDRTNAVAAIEYSDALLSDGLESNYNTIKETLDKSLPKAGNCMDILQLYAIEYLKLGRKEATEQAAHLLKVLVNENYNADLNAMILSRLYVSMCLKNGLESGAYEDYQLLKVTASTSILFPMPTIDDLKNKEVSEKLEAEYLLMQRNNLKKDYILMLHSVYRSYSEKFNKIVWNENNVDFNKTVMGVAVNPAEIMFKTTLVARDKKITKISADKMAQLNYRYRFIDELNKLIDLLDSLSSFRDSLNRKQYIRLIEVKIQHVREKMEKYQKKMEADDFYYSDLQELKSSYSFSYFVDDFFKKYREDIIKKIDECEDSAVLESMTIQMIDFCQTNGFEIQKQVYDSTDDILTYGTLSYDLLGDNLEKERIKNERIDLISERISELKNVFENETLWVKPFPADYLDTIKDDEHYEDVSDNGIAILTDPLSETDIIFNVEGFALVKNNKVTAERSYNMIHMKKSLGEDVLDLGYGDVYKTSVEKMVLLDDLIKNIKSILKTVC